MESACSCPDRCLVGLPEVRLRTLWDVLFPPSERVSEASPQPVHPLWRPSPLTLSTKTHKSKLSFDNMHSVILSRRRFNAGRMRLLRRKKNHLKKNHYFLTMLNFFELFSANSPYKISLIKIFVNWRQRNGGTKSQWTSGSSDHKNQQMRIRALWLSLVSAPP